MKSSCIRHPEKEPLIVLRQWQVELCDGNKCAALLLSYFEYWHNIKLEQRQKAIEANDIAEKHGDNRDREETLYQFHTEPQLEEGLLGLYKRTKIGSSLELLAHKGFITIIPNPNPKYKFDKTRHFLFHDDVVNEKLWGSRSTTSGGSSTENGSRQTENGSRQTENGSAIPKTTSKTTTETSTAAEKIPPTPHEKIKTIYNTICKSLPRVYSLSETRKDHLRARWKQFDFDIAPFEDAFRKAQASDWCKGDNPRKWKADFDWLIVNDLNIVKVLEGKYDNKEKETFDHPSFRKLN